MVALVASGGELLDGNTRAKKKTPRLVMIFGPSFSPQAATHPLSDNRATLSTLRRMVAVETIQRAVSYHVECSKSRALKCRINVGTGLPVWFFVF